MSLNTNLPQNGRVRNADLDRILKEKTLIGAKFERNPDLDQILKEKTEIWAKFQGNPDLDQLLKEKTWM